MAKFSARGKGIAGGETIDFEIRPGVVDRIRIVPLLGTTDTDIAERAASFATARGGKAVDGDKVYNQGWYAHTCLAACQDADSSADKPEPYFDGGIDQILDPKDGLDRDRLALLFEHQLRIQDAYAPRPGKQLGAEQFFDWLERTAEVDEGLELPFERSPRATQREFVRGIARQAKASLFPRSTDGQSLPEKQSPSERPASSSTPGVAGDG